MPSVFPYSLLVAGFLLTASLVVLGSSDVSDDPCPIINTCQACVVQKINITEGNNGTCIWEITRTGQICSSTFRPSEETSSTVYKVEGCNAIHSSTTPAPDTTTAPPTPSNATTTTTPAPSTNGTTTAPTTTTSTTPAPTTNGTTTTTPTTTAAPTNGTTPATTPAPPSNTTTTAAPTPAPKPAPKSGGFSWASFIGGIVFAAALSSLAYLIFRFYKVRLDRNYHTFSNPTF